MSKRPIRTRAEVQRDTRRNNARKLARACFERLNPAHRNDLFRLTWDVPRFPLAALVALTKLRTGLADVEREMVLLARANGVVWEDIAWALEVTRQGAMARHPEADDLADIVMRTSRGQLAAALTALTEWDDDE